MPLYGRRNIDVRTVSAVAGLADTPVYHSVLGRAMIEKPLCGQAVKKSDFSTERKLYILKPRFLVSHTGRVAPDLCRAPTSVVCGVPPGPKEK